MRSQVVLFTLLILCLASSVQAVGLGALDLKPEFDFEPNTVKTFPYQITHTASTPMTYRPTVEGPFAHYVQFIPAEIANVQPGQRPWFNAVVSLPAETELTPGEHVVRVGVSEQAAEGQIAALTGIRVPITMRVLYPGPFLNSEFRTYNTNINEPAGLEFLLENAGQQAIEAVFAEITIFDAEDQNVGSVVTETISVPPASKKTLNGLFDTLGLRPGSYTAKALIRWDEGEQEHTSTFRIGISDVSITSHSTKFNTGKINPFVINIESVWNNHISGVYADILVNGNTLTTPTVGIDSFAQAELKAFWDLSTAEPGNYPGEIILYYQGNTKKKSFTASVTSEQIVIDPVEQEPVSSGSPLVTIIVMVIILNGLVWIYLYIKKRNQEEE